MKKATYRRKHVIRGWLTASKGGPFLSWWRTWWQAGRHGAREVAGRQDEPEWASWHTS